MFTGLIQQVGALTNITDNAGGLRMLIRAAWPEPLQPGESVAVNGVCLTAAVIAPGEMACDILPETFRRTNLAHKRSGDQLNLERALRLNAPLGGHLVTGHVDGTGIVRQVKAAGRDLEVCITCAADILAGMVPKGSIAVDGVSLTLVKLDHASFSVQLVPFTRQHTAAAAWRAGAMVNLETDIIGKYVRRYMESGTAGAGITNDMLQRAGFHPDPSTMA